jgi:hypothetical protein
MWLLSDPLVGHTHASAWFVSVCFFGGGVYQDK